MWSEKENVLGTILRRVAGRLVHRLPALLRFSHRSSNLTPR